MSMSGIRGSKHVFGGLTKGDAIAMGILVIFMVVSGSMFGMIENLFFTEWNTARYAGLDPTWILNQFNMLCVLMFLFAAMPFFILVVFSIMQGNRNRAIFFGIMAIIMIPIWILFEDFVAHLLYGADPAGDWNDWFFASNIMYSPYHTAPGWYFFVIGFVMLMIVWFAWVYARRRGTIYKTLR